MVGADASTPAKVIAVVAAVSPNDVEPPTMSNPGCDMSPVRDGSVLPTLQLAMASMPDVCKRTAEVAFKHNFPRHLIPYVTGVAQATRRVGNSCRFFSGIGVAFNLQSTEPCLSFRKRYELTDVDRAFWSMPVMLARARHSWQPLTILRRPVTT